MSDAKKYIDVEDLRIELMLTFPAYALMMSDIVDELSSTLSMQCKDCVNWTNHDKRCGRLNHGMKPTDYCSYYERI